MSLSTINSFKSVSIVKLHWKWDIDCLNNLFIYSKAKPQKMYSITLCCCRYSLLVGNSEKIVWTKITTFISKTDTPFDIRLDSKTFIGISSLGFKFISLGVYSNSLQFVYKILKCNCTKLSPLSFEMFAVCLQNSWFNCIFLSSWFKFNQILCACVLLLYHGKCHNFTVYFHKISNMFGI